MASSLFSLFYEGVRVWLTPPPLHGIYETEVISTRMLDTHTLAIKFKDVTTRPQAMELVGRSILIELDGEIKAELATQFDSLIIGRSVSDKEHGNLGTITQIIETGANDVWVIDGPFGEFMIPVIDDVVKRVPRNEKKPISVKLLKGLLPE